MSKTRPKRAHGQIRQSQLITTFGPGAMIDLPDHSVLLAGLDYWFPLGEEISEPRLQEKLCRLLEVPTIQLRLPCQFHPRTHLRTAQHRLRSLDLYWHDRC